MNYDRIRNLIAGKFWRLALGLAGLICAVLILTIGLEKTLVIVLLTAGCGAIGYFIDRPRSAVVKKHRWLVVFAAAGLVTAVLMLTIGFFRTLLIILLLGIFGGFGFLVDRAGFSGARDFIVGFFRRGK